MACDAHMLKWGMGEHGELHYMQTTDKSNHCGVSMQ